MPGAVADVEAKNTVLYRGAVLVENERNGVSEGTGHPEHLKYRKEWSRRIDHGNRLVYDVVDGNLWIIACKGHYED